MIRFIATLAAVILAIAAQTGAVLAQESYRLRSGDVLRIEVIEDAGLNRSVLVAPDGRISVPLAGSIAAAGRPIEAVQAELAARLAPNFATTPTVFVSIERLGERRAAGTVAPATLTVHVLGEAGRAGKITVPPGTTLLQAFAEMGGFSKFAALRRIQLRRPDGRGGETVYPIDYTAIERGQSNAGMTVLRDGDVILVPQRGLFE